MPQHPQSYFNMSSYDPKRDIKTDNTTRQDTRHDMTRYDTIRCDMLYDITPIDNSLVPGNANQLLNQSDIVGMGYLA